LNRVGELEVGELEIATRKMKTKKRSVERLHPSHSVGVVTGCEQRRR
jgi:hypothetical protein